MTGKLATTSTALVVTLTVEQLRELVRESVADLIDDFPASEPGLMDQAGLSRALKISVSTIHKLRAAGLPTIYVGESPRFVLDEVVGWLRARKESAA